VHLVLVNDRLLDEEANQKNKERLVDEWKFWAPDLIYKSAPGNHMTVLKPPHVLDLASLVCAEVSHGDTGQTTSLIDQALSVYTPGAQSSHPNRVSTICERRVLEGTG
jgi:hypothetical protein